MWITEYRPDGTDDRHLEAVENPGDAERDNDKKMKATPRKPIEASRNVSHDRGMFRLMFYATPRSGAADLRTKRHSDINPSRP